MMMKKGSVDAGLFLVRLALGVVFIAHGWQKFANMDATVGFFGTLGLAPFFAYLVAAIELLGGLAVLLGVFARVAAVLLVLVMIGAIAMVKSKVGFFGGYEFDLALLLAALAVAVSGAGCFALMRGEGACNCGGGSCGCGTEAPKA